MKKWQQRICLMLVCLFCVTAGLTVSVSADDCEHAYVEKEVKATCTEAGFVYEECELCGSTRNHQNTDPLGHEYGEWIVTVEPSCGVKGEEEHSCVRCGNKETQEVAALEHDYKESTVMPTCTEMGYDQIFCMNCGNQAKDNYTDALGHNYEFTETVAPTCTGDGYDLHTCTRCQETKQENVKSKLGHTWKSEVVAPTCTADGYTLHTCSVCRAEEKTDYVDKLGHDWESEVVAPTCDEEGYTLNICVVCREREKTDYVDALGHEWGEPELVDPTCEKQGYTLKICTVCQKAEKTDYVDALDHNWEGTKVAATCTDRGFTQNKCTVCGKQEKVDYVDALDHDLVTLVVKPTCTAKGYTHVACKRCDYEEKSNSTDKIPHAYDEGVVTKEATDTAMGRITYTCTVCGDTKTETTPKLENPFEDVSKTAYYYKPVLWAVSEGITSGMDETHFAPNASCTRAQVVTFLWRAAGSPNPKTTECPFKDVKATDYFYKAVLWALENEITSGISSTQFGPGSPCTRAQVVTFLYRAAGSPEWEATERFQDVPRGAYYFTSVSWAADMGITSGVDGEHFGPNQTCTRAQVVTFLYRNEYAQAPETEPEEKPSETPEA